MRDNPTIPYKEINLLHKYETESVGKLHRDCNKPASITYEDQENKKTHVAMYYVNGVFHRDDGGPTHITHRKDGEPKTI